MCTYDISVFVSQKKFDGKTERRENRIYINICTLGFFNAHIITHRFYGLLTITYATLSSSIFCFMLKRIHKMYITVLEPAHVCFSLCIIKVIVYAKYGFSCTFHVLTR